MPIFPDENVHRALEQAAVKNGVPVTLLMGIAFAESSFKPSAVGPKTRLGWSAQGLMQLSPQIIARYGVTDPLNAAQSADAAAQLLKNLAKPLNWNVPRMLASYNWGVGNVANATNTGKPWPKEVFSYVNKVMAARLYYEDQAQPDGATLLEKINNAVTGLRRLNPAWAPALALEKMWSGWYALHRADDVAQQLNVFPELTAMWRAYADAFVRAPLTDGTTPLPSKIEPDAWKRATQLIEDGKKKFDDVGARLGELGIGGLGLALILLAIAFSGGGRRS